MRNIRRRAVRGVSSLLLCAATLWTVSVLAPARDLSGAVRALREDSSLALSLLRFERGVLFPRDDLSPASALALRMTPLLYAVSPEEAAEVWSDELQLPPDPAQDTEEHEGTVLTHPDAERPSVPAADNGVPASTLRPSDPAGYVVLGNVFVNNASASALDTSQLTLDFPAKMTEDGPQVLIVHTHGSEAYTMPPGQEYAPSDNHRTLDMTCNVVRVGDEIAQVLSDAGLGVLHDRTLYDYPSYSGAYNRSLAAIEEYRRQYPSLLYILDVHRDAIEDRDGNERKVLCAEEPSAAQIEFVVGSDGGGAAHPRWRDNLALACAVQSDILADYPTLMRPIVVRNSRYNQHVTPGSLLVEMGTAGNSLDEALAAARLFAQHFAATVQG